MRNLITAIAMVAAALFGSSTDLFAQTETARISGTVVDSQERPIVGVTVTATSTTSSATRTTVTDGNGKYAIANLLPAAYEVTFRLNGFKTLTRTLQLAVGTDVGADVTLEVGAVREVVAVSAPIELLNMRAPEVSTTIA